MNYEAIATCIAYLIFIAWVVKCSIRYRAIRKAHQAIWKGVKFSRKYKALKALRVES